VAGGANSVAIREMSATNCAAAGVEYLADPEFALLFRRRFMLALNDFLEDIHGWFEGNGSFNDSSEQVACSTVQLTNLFVGDSSHRTNPF
jgi:hypothetical protein